MEDDALHNPPLLLLVHRRRWTLLSLRTPMSLERMDSAAELFEVAGDVTEKDGIAS